MLTPRKYHAMFLAALAAALLLLALGMALTHSLLLGAGLLLAFAAFVLRVLFFRCPHCGWYLGRRSGAWCPHCKRELE